MAQPKEKYTPTGKYKALHLRGGYEHILTEGQVYYGQEQEGIFPGSPYLVVLNDDHEEIAAAHLHRFEKVEEY